MLALVYLWQKRYDEAEPLYLETLEGRKRVLGDDHPHTLQSMNRQAGLYKALGGGWGTRRVADFVPPHIEEQMRQRTDWDGWLPGPTPGSGEAESEAGTVGSEK